MLDAALRTAYAAIPRYFWAEKYLAHGPSGMQTDPENPKRGEWIKAADLDRELQKER